MIQSWLAQMGEGVVSIAISCAAAILSGLVLVIRSNRDDRVRAHALVVEIWKMWMSPEMRRVRVLISCAIRGSEHGPPRGEKKH